MSNIKPQPRYQIIRTPLIRLCKDCNYYYYPVNGHTCGGIK